MKTVEGEGEVDKYIDVLLLAIAAFMYFQISLLPTYIITFFGELLVIKESWWRVSVG